MYLKKGFVFCVFMASADSKRNTHTLPRVSTSYSIPRDLYTYLAPMTAVLLLKTNFSSNVYMPPGIVPKAAVSSAMILFEPLLVFLTPSE